MAREYVIWSMEHRAWWRAGWMGYADTLAGAGRYSQREAEEILQRANLVAVNECMIPVAALETAAESPLVSWGDTREKAE